MMQHSQPFPNIISSAFPSEFKKPLNSRWHLHTGFHNEIDEFRMFAISVWNDMKIEFIIDCEICIVIHSRRYKVSRVSKTRVGSTISTGYGQKFRIRLNALEGVCASRRPRAISLGKVLNKFWYHISNFWHFSKSDYVFLHK